jgi:hypothetical protein
MACAFSENASGSSVRDQVAFVHDHMGRLLEEYRVAGTQTNLVGRYYYGNSDAPLAADLLNATTVRCNAIINLKDSRTRLSQSRRERQRGRTNMVRHVRQAVIEQFDGQAPVIQKIVATMPVNIGRAVRIPSRP